MLLSTVGALAAPTGHTARAQEPGFCASFSAGNVDLLYLG